MTVKKLFLVCSAVLALAAPAWAGPGDLKLTIGEGRVTLIADNVPVRTILQEWARLGQSKIVNGEKVLGAPVTLRLIDVPEDQALDIVLRSASGYLAAPREVQMANASRFDRIVILATSRPTTSAAAPPPSSPSPERPQPAFQPNPNIAPPPVEDDQDPSEEPPNPQSAQPQQPVTAPRPGPIQITPPVGAPSGVQQSPNQLPVTSARPGVIPPPQQPQQPPQPPPRPIP